MTDETPRTIEMSRLAKGRYVATNARGGQLVLGQGDESFSPVELLLVAIAGCSAIDVDFITSKRAEPASFTVETSGEKLRDEDGRNHMGELTVRFAVTFPDGEAGDRAREMLPKAIAMSHDRLCTVSQTVLRETPIDSAEA